MERGILSLNFDVHVYILHFLADDNIYAYKETCSFFYNLIKYIKNNFKNLPNCVIKDKPPSMDYITQSINLIKWAENNKKFKCNFKTVLSATIQGNLDVLKYLKKNNSIFFNDTCLYYYSSKNGHFDIIKYLFKEGIKPQYTALNGAVEYGDLKIIKWMLRNNFPYYRDTLCYEAAYHNKINILRYFVEVLEFEYSDIIFDYAAEGGNIKILKYLLKRSSCDLSIRAWWSTSTTASAAETGQLKTLKWLRKKLCNWDVSTSYNAVVNNQIETLKWAIENGCPVDEVLFSCLPSYGLNYRRNQVNIVEI
jgi:hypothetical protein